MSKPDILREITYLAVKEARKKFPSVAHVYDATSFNQAYKSMRDEIYKNKLKEYLGEELAEKAIREVRMHLHEPTLIPDETYRYCREQRLILAKLENYALKKELESQQSQ